jgi:hypothetical protein
MKPLFSVLFLVVFIMLGSAHITAFFPQEYPRLLTKPKFQGAPLEIVHISKEGKRLEFDQPFAAEDGWLKGVEFVLENKSAHTITYFSVALSLPNTNGGKYPMTIPIAEFGTQSFIKDTKPEKLLRPASQHTIQISQKMYDLVVQLLTQRGRSVPNQAEIKISQIVFDDDTMWREGRLHSRDPQDPNRWNVIRKSSQLQSIKESPQRQINDVTSSNLGEKDGSTLSLLNSFTNGFPFLAKSVSKKSDEVCGLYLATVQLICGTLNYPDLGTSFNCYGYQEIYSPVSGGGFGLSRYRLNNPDLPCVHIVLTAVCNPAFYTQDSLIDPQPPICVP